ncbi:MAG TPA: MarR family transcriptional regulator [Vicinamibacteria bacterium]|nr:MarR family transcriptional regulator [Vicinamibacteria bacterium]
MKLAPERDAARLRSAIRALVGRFAVSERADVACCGVTVAQAAALEALEAEGPMRLGDLGRRLGIAPSTLTRNLARLEASGLVEREADAEDARSIRVGLRPEGRRAARAVAAQEEEFARRVLESLPAARRAVVVESLGELLAAVRAATEECCPGAFDHLVAGLGTAGGEQGTGAGAGGCGEACACGPAERRGART